MIRNRVGTEYPTVIAAVAAALAYSRAYPTDNRLALSDLRNLQANLDAIIASAAVQAEAAGVVRGVGQ